jgi:hypothetical protein
LSTDTLKAHEVVYISNACKRAIKLAYADLIEMKKAYLEAKTYWDESGSGAEHHWYWKGSADTIESIVTSSRRHMFVELKKMGLDKKMLYMMYGAQKYADYYEAVIAGEEAPLEFKVSKEVPEDD